METAERMSGVDRAWLLMDRPSNPMIVIGLMVFQSPLERAALRELVAARFLRFHRFRCVPVTDALGASWLESEQFNVDDHISFVALPSPGGQAELQTLLGELASTPLHTGRPLWSFHLVERYAEGSALIVRIHHCYADGVALVQVLLSLCNGSCGTRAKPPGSSVTDTSMTNVFRWGANLLESGIHLLLHPAEVPGVAREALGFAGELAQIAVLADDPATHLKQPLSGIRRAAWAAPLALEEVRTIGHLLGCTVNDVLVSTLAGALGRYLAREGDCVTGVTVRAAVPVNLRQAADSSTLGNQFGLVFVDLPVGVRDPLQRLWTVHESIQKLKGSQQALTTFGLLSVIGTLPAAVEDPAIAVFSAKASLVASNLPGPREPLVLAGAPISQLLFWVPQAGSIGTGVSMLTYCGQVQLGVISDRQLVRDPAGLVAEMGAEFERLVYLTLLAAGPPPPD